MGDSPKTPPFPPPSPTQHKRALSAVFDADLSAENRRKAPKVSRACDLCKARKVRCSGTMPCDICSKKNLDCVYNAKYSRGRARTPPSASENPIQRVAEPLDRPSTSFINYQVNGSVPPEQRPAQVSPEAEMVEHDGNQPAETPAAMSFLHRAWDRLSRQAAQETSESSTSIKLQGIFHAGDRPVNPLTPTTNAANTALERPTHRELLRFYFDYCVVTYRMFHKQTVDSWLDEALKHGATWVETIGGPRASILLTMFAIASLRKHRIDGDPVDEAAALAKSDGYLAAASKLNENEIGFPKLESAQSRLLQVIYLLESSRWNQAWYTFGNAVQLISALGLHRRLTQSRWAAVGSESPDCVLLECRKRTFWTAYTMDRWLSIVFGRPRTYHDDDINQESPERANDEDITSTGISVNKSADDSHIESLRCHAELAHYVGIISRDVYSAKRTTLADRMKLARRYTEALHKWRRELPAHLGTVKPSSLIPSFRRQSTALKLAYANAVMHANRPFLLAKPGVPGDVNGVERSIEDCLSGALEALQMYETMSKDETLIHAYWFTPYAVFSACAIIYIWDILQRSAARPTINAYHVLQTSRELFDFAEISRARLAKTPGAEYSPTKRYLLILDELRHEARQHQQQPSRQSSQPVTPQLHAGFTAVNRAGTEMDMGMMQEQDPRMDLSGLPEMFAGWQPTDWVDLDSAAFDSFADLAPASK